MKHNQEDVNLTRNLDIYKSMLRIRMVEECIASNYSKQEMRCPTHLSIGQEGIAAAISSNLLETDTAVSTHRCHAHYLAKGGNLKRMIAEIYGKETGCSKGKGGSMHLIDKSAGFMGSSAIVGNSIPIGTGIALNNKLKGLNSISVIYFGEGATEEGVFYESLNFAAIHSLNVIFVCENNLYSVYTPLAPRQPNNRNLIGIAESMGICNALSLDGNDAFSSAEKISKEIQEMRKCNRPLLLEMSTYRWREHCGPNYDNDVGYRTTEEYEGWRNKDPLEKCRAELANKIKSFDKLDNSLKETLEIEIREAFFYAQSSRFPDISEVYTNIYSNS